MITKTRVFKGRSGRWNVLYYMPYSGVLRVDFATWQEAVDEACKVEKAKEWV